MAFVLVFAVFAWVHSVDAQPWPVEPLQGPLYVELQR